MLVIMETEQNVPHALETQSNHLRVTRRVVILNVIQQQASPIQNGQHVVRIKIFALIVSSTNVNFVRIGFSLIVNLFPPSVKKPVKTNKKRLIREEIVFGQKPSSCTGLVSPIRQILLQSVKLVTMVMGRTASCVPGTPLKQWRETHQTVTRPVIG